VIGMFSQICGGGARNKFSRATAGVCVLLWMLGSVSTLYGSLTPQWTTPHCPQGQTSSGQHSHSHCVWHCDGIDTQGVTGKRAGISVDPNGMIEDARIELPYTAIAWVVIGPRGPPGTTPRGNTGNT
jgi:hypothetical protein